MRSASSLLLRRATFVFCLSALVLAPAGASSQLRRDRPTALSDAEFWDFFTSMSEQGGSFPSENFVSNEMTFQHVIPTLQRTVPRDGVYLGVGPEQNFTYIANLKPRMAVIFDIRRQNAMAHLMYKAIFELSPTRGDFVSRLFSRPLAGRVAATAKVNDMFAVASAAARNDSAYEANQRAIFSTLVGKHRFALSPGDSAAIEHLLEAFYEAGPDINYGFRSGRTGTAYSTYPGYGTIQTQTNVDSVPMAFLANEENYQAVRGMHLRNMIIPVVGDFAGPKAIRSVAEYLRQRSLTVSAFYLSNVEQYLFQNGVADQFYENVATLPIDTMSTFIRSVPGGGGFGGAFSVTSRNGAIGNFNGGMITGAYGASGSYTSIVITDTAGYRRMRISQDTAGQTVTRSYRDSAGSMILMRTEVTPTRVVALQQSDTLLLNSVRAAAARQDSLVGRLAPGTVPIPFSSARRTIATGGSSLTSGIASIRLTLAQHQLGTIYTYRDIIAMTKIDGWR
ncbi:MAG: hypothetical protein ABIR92_05165 [Gemmatimonadaceae bacterium]